MSFFGFRILLVLLVTRIIKYSYDEGSKCFFGYRYLQDPRQPTQQNLRMINLISKTLPNRIKGREQRIPYMWHQTNEQDLLPSDMVMAIETLQEKNPQYAYRFYNATERREFIEKHMGPTVLACYDKLVPNAYKADLFRYSAILTHGGCYSDIGFVFVRPLRDVLWSNDTFISTPDGLDLSAKINSAFFCAQQGHPILSLTIKRIVQHVSTSNYTYDILDITGPGAFIKGFLAYFNNSVHVAPIAYAQYTNGVRLLQQQLRSQCHSYPVIDTLGDGSGILLHKYPRYLIDISTTFYGLHYSLLWRQRTVFNQSVAIPADGEYLIRA